MMTQGRLKNWNDLSADQKRQQAGKSVERAEILNDHTQAFLALAELIGPEVNGLLGGLPFAVKDMFDCPPHCPSWGLSESPIRGEKHEQAAVLKRLEHAGGVSLGFTRMTALAYEPSGVNHFQSAPLNPWNRNYAPGASSSGSAVAVASGQAFVALGSDTAGSLRIPAQGCGVTAWKPTHGIVSNEGAMPLAPSLDAIGLMARSAADIMLAAPVITPGLRWSDSLAATTGIVRMDAAFAVSDPEIANLCHDACDTFIASGQKIIGSDDYELIQKAGDGAMVILQYEAARAHETRLTDPAFDPLLAKRLGKGFEIDQTTYHGALSERTSHHERFQSEILGDNAAILLPVMPITTPPLSKTDNYSDSFSARTLYALSTFTRFVNYLGLPAVALPVGFDERGLPVSAQIVGPPHSDLQLLSLAHGFQERTDWHGRLPTELLPHRDLFGDLVT